MTDVEPLASLLEQAASELESASEHSCLDLQHWTVYIMMPAGCQYCCQQCQSGADQPVPEPDHPFWHPYHHRHPGYSHRALGDAHRCYQFKCYPILRITYRYQQVVESMAVLPHRSALTVESPFRCGSAAR